jgi:parallel beta-helix repeat protein
LQKTALFIIIVGLLVGCLFAPSLHVQPTTSGQATIVVPDDFPTVQEAVNKASVGDTILVKPGTYRENVLVNKSISLIGEDRYHAVIDGSNLGTVIEVSASNVSVENLTLTNAGSSVNECGIMLSGVENCSISENVLIPNSYEGIMLYQSVGDSVTANTVEGSGQSGIILYGSNNSVVSENTVQNASMYGIALQHSYYCQVTQNIVTGNYEGIALLASDRNFVSRNTVTESATLGIRLDDPSNYNTFTENAVANNYEYGFWMWYSSYNLFYHNVCNNTNNVLVLSAPEQGYNSTNAWDDGYPEGGNYWSDYLTRYPDATENDSSGIWNTPYIIDKYNVDRYPLMTPLAIEYPVHNLETGLGYDTIEEAINAPHTLDTHTILVDSGTYYENIVVTKAVKLVGESEETTIIDGGGRGTVIELAADNVTVQGLTLRNSGVGWAQGGIVLNQVANCTITNNEIAADYYGVWAESSTDNIISADNFSNDGYGIGLYNSSDSNSIVENNVTASAHAGILLASCVENDLSGNKITDSVYGVELVSSSNNTITGDDVAYNGHGLALYESSNDNEVSGNSITGNAWGFETDTSLDNRIYHNNFIDNTRQVFFYDHGYPNVWDTGYPGGGNYWSDGNNTDLYSGPYQNETGSDGIADAPHSINSDNEDHYPLAGMFYDLTVYPVSPQTGGTEQVDLISNSTVTDLQYLAWSNPPTPYVQPGQLVIEFQAEQENATVSFFRLTIPRTILNASTYTVLVDEKPVSITQLETTNSTTVYLYFTYTAPMHEIIVTIPEVPWTIIQTIIILATSTLAVFLRKKAQSSKRRDNA